MNESLKISVIAYCPDIVFIFESIAAETRANWVAIQWRYVEIWWDLWLSTSSRGKAFIMGTTSSQQSHSQAWISSIISTTSRSTTNRLQVCISSLFSPYFFSIKPLIVTGFGFAECRCIVKRISQTHRSVDHRESYNKIWLMRKVTCIDVRRCLYRRLLIKTIIV